MADLVRMRGAFPKNAVRTRFKQTFIPDRRCGDLRASTERVRDKFTYGSKYSSVQNILSRLNLPLGVNTQALKISSPDYCLLHFPSQVRLFTCLS